MGALSEGKADNALVIAHLVAAQQQKATNIIAYLNSDTSTWAAEDETVVRQYLGLTSGLMAEEDEDSTPEEISFDGPEDGHI